MKNRVIRQYCRRVGRILVCRRTTRRSLLEGLEQELLTTCGPDVKSMAALKAKVGKPERVALELQETVSSTEQAEEVLKIKRIAIIVSIIALILVVAMYIHMDHYIKHAPYIYIETITEGS